MHRQDPFLFSFNKIWKVHDPKAVSPERYTPGLPSLQLMTDHSSSKVLVLSPAVSVPASRHFKSTFLCIFNNHHRASSHIELAAQIFSYHLIPAVSRFHRFWVVCPILVFPESLLFVIHVCTKTFSWLVSHVIAAYLVYSSSRDKTSKSNSTRRRSNPTEPTVCQPLQLSALLSLTVTAVLHCDLRIGHNTDAVVLHSFLVSVPGKNKGKGWRRGAPQT